MCLLFLYRYMHTHTCTHIDAHTQLHTHSYTVPPRPLTIHTLVICRPIVSPIPTHCYYPPPPPHPPPQTTRTGHLAHLQLLAEAKEALHIIPLTIGQTSSSQTLTTALTNMVHAWTGRVSLAAPPQQLQVLLHVRQRLIGRLWGGLTSRFVGCLCL